MLKFKSDDLIEVSRVHLDTRVRPHIRIINGALDEDQTSPSAIVLQGRIDSSTLRFLKVDDYQRKLESRADIWDALKNRITLPNIEIGVRGQDFDTDGDDFIVYSPAYIVDGWQRCGNALRMMETIPDHPIRLFGSVHFGTTYSWEAHRFTELNKNVRKVSPNQHLRNMRDQNDAVLTLYGLSNNAPDFPLYKKVCWSQNMSRGELVSALVLCKVAMVLHSHKVSIMAGQTDQIVRAVSNAANTVSLPIFRRNISTFFAIINECWPINTLEYRHTATQIKSSFMMELARMFSRHATFWDGMSEQSLSVSADDLRKLKKFAINDNQVAQLAGSPGAARKILYQLLVDHMNSGRRTQRLSER